MRRTPLVLVVTFAVLLVGVGVLASRPAQPPAEPPRRPSTPRAPAETFVMPGVPVRGPEGASDAVETREAEASGWRDAVLDGTAAWLAEHPGPREDEVLTTVRGYVELREGDRLAVQEGRMVPATARQRAGAAREGMATRARLLLGDQADDLRAFLADRVAGGAW